MRQSITAESLLAAQEVSTTHLLYDGEGGWIEAKQVWQEAWAEIYGPDDGWGWEFKSAGDCIRWLRA